MAFQGLTPESLLGRSDSKNPATTCKGLTTSGRPCRRGLGSTPGSSPNATPTKGPKGVTSDDESAENAGVMAIIDSTNAAAFFCWQHKDQAQNLIAKIESQQRQEQQHSDLQRRRTRIVPLQKRSSIDTLVERVGIIDLDGDVNDREGDFRQARPNASQGGSNRPVNVKVKVKKRDTLPVEWQGIQGPLMSVPEEIVKEVAPEPRIQRRRSRSRSRNRFDQRDSRQEKISNMPVRPRPKSSWSCCGSSNNDYNDDGPPVRRRERHEQRRPSRSQSRPRSSTGVARPTSYSGSATSRPAPQSQVRPHMQMQERAQYQPSNYDDRPIPSQRQQWQQQSNYSSQPQSTPTRQTPISTTIPTQNTTTSSSSPPHSQTTHFLSLIPPHLDPVTTSALLTELSKSFAKDDDAGYIYIYWLTPSSSSPNNPNNIDNEEDKPDDDIASTILDSDSDSDIDLTSEASYQPSHSRRRSKPGASHHHPRSKSTSKSTSTLRKAALTRYASTKTPNSQPNSSSTTTTPTKSPSAPPKILLKIGRATNVHRRMTQWSKQCGQNITLVRYYPYQSSSSNKGFLETGMSEGSSSHPQWPAKIHLDDSSIPRLPPPLASSSYRGHSRSRTTIDIPPLLPSPSRSPSHSPTRSSTFLPFFSTSRSSSPRRTTASPAEAAEFTIDEEEEQTQRKERPGAVVKLASWFEGSSEPVNIGLVASPKQGTDQSDADSQVMETMFSGSSDSVPSLKDQKPIMQSANSSTSRFSLFSRKSSTVQHKSNSEDLATLDIKGALFPDGAPDEFSPAAFKNLQQNAESLLRLLQTAYKENLATLKKTTSERNVQADELEAEQTRSAHLKMQLTEMSDRAREQEKLLISMTAENERLRANEAALKSIRVITDHTALDRPSTPEHNGKSQSRRNRTSDISFVESVDSAGTDMTHADSVFSHEAEGGLAEQMRSPGTSIGCPSPTLKHVSVPVTPSIQRSPQTEHLRSLTTNIMVAECQKCRGMKPQEAWEVLSIIQPENQALKARVVELEKAVEEAFNICVWHAEI